VLDGEGFQGHAGLPDGCLDVLWMPVFAFAVHCGFGPASG
jgi:hypothetical protein